jgi:hypothetical protein
VQQRVERRGADKDNAADRRDDARRDHARRRHDARRDAARPGDVRRRHHGPATIGDHGRWAGVHVRLP